LAKYIPVNIFFHSKSHYPVSRLAQAGTTNEEKVNWSFFKFVTTSREQTWCENVRIVCKSLPKSEQNDIFWGKTSLCGNFTPGTLIPAKYIELKGS
jgi:hypothetical protein